MLNVHNSSILTSGGAGTRVGGASAGVVGGGASGLSRAGNSALTGETVMY